MRKKLDIDTLENRHKQLKEKYIQKALKNNQLLIDLYNEHQQFNKDHGITDPKYSMFNITWKGTLETYFFFFFYSF